MLLKQYYLGCLAHASYLIGDEKTKTAVVVDPQRDIDQYLADAEVQGFEIRHVVLTHFHADFLAGHIELRNRTGAQIHLGAQAQAEYTFSALADGATIELGDVRLQALETPGHTPEAICLLVFDLKQSSDEPHAVLTGDTLFIGDVGRPDLMASVGVSADELARKLYRSLREKLLPLPDATLVYPAHGAGSMCGKNLSTDTVSTIGAQREHNYALQEMTEEEFVGLVTADQPQTPDYFAFAARLNQKERRTLDQVRGELAPRSLDEVIRLRNSGAQLLDVRDAAEFEAGHLVGSTNIGLGGNFASWCGTILDRKRPILILADDGKHEEAATRLGRIGFDHVAGYLDDAASALASRRDLVERTEHVSADGLAELLASDEPPLVVDVRTEREWETDHIEGSQNVPLNQLTRRIRELAFDRRTVVSCQTGYRSAVAASLLQKAGLKQVIDQVGGFDAWKARATGTKQVS